MHFEGEVLISIDGNVVTPHWRGNIPKLRPFNIDLVDSENPIKHVLHEWIDEYGRQWVSEFSGSENRVNCPDGTLTPGDVEPDVPTTSTPDLWYCKHTGEPCPIQASIPIDSESAFIEGCNVEEAAEELDRPPEQYKRDIFGAVKEGSFTGEHHMMAREPCWRCQQEGVRDDMHDPWALTALYSHLGEETMERKIEFRKAGLESWIGNPICAECFLKLPDTFPDIEFRKWGVDFEQYESIPYRLDFD